MTSKMSDLKALTAVLEGVATARVETPALGAKAEADAKRVARAMVSFILDITLWLWVID